MYSGLRIGDLSFCLRDCQSYREVKLFVFIFEIGSFMRD